MEKKKEKTITKDMAISEILEKVPESAEIMQSYGLHCIGCHINAFESLEQGALGHGLDEEVIENMVKEINEVAAKNEKSMEKREGIRTAEKNEEKAEASIELTDIAAKKIIEIRDQQNKGDCALRIGIVAGGCAGYSYTMDFEKTPDPDDYVMEIKGVKIFIDKKSADLLKGTIIDYVESLQGAGFRFSNPNAHANCSCGKSFS